MDNDLVRPARWRGESLLVPFRRNTYRSLGYLLIALPLGLAYAVLLTAGFALGFGLLPVVAGIPILSLTLTCTWRLARFERGLAAQVLGEPFRESDSIDDGGASWWSMLRARMVDRRTYWAAGLLITKLPVGILSLMFAALALAPTLYLVSALILSPFADRPTPFPVLAIDGIPTFALALSLVPIPLLVALHVLVRAARFLARLTLRAYDARVPTTDRASKDQPGRPARIEHSPPDRFEQLGI